MDDENVVHIHKRLLFSCKENEIMSFAGKWMELEKIVLTWVTLTQKKNVACSLSSEALKFKSSNVRVVFIPLTGNFSFQQTDYIT